MMFTGLLVCLATLGAAQVDPNRIVAVVDGQEIKGAEYYRRMEYLPGVGTLVGNTFQQFYPGFMTLQELINEKLIFELAKSKGVMPTDAEIQDELKNRLDMDSQYEQKYLASGQTHAELLYDLKFELAQLNLLTAGITVTDQEVEQFYKDNKQMFTISPQVKLRVIAVGSAKEATAVDDEIAAGKAFTDIAKSHSIDASAPIGGDIGLRSLDEFSEEVRDVLAKTQAGQITKWFPTASGPNEFRFQVVEVIPEKLQPLTPQVRRQARLRMRMDRGRIRNNVKKDLNDLRKKATIDIKDKSLADAYKKFIDAYLKATGDD
ncbi:MAG TPA: peptidyl-prolyl cis-trans isomerase [Fimbriimonadaceae bacterium]|nr:peptidyl-prolyl cis-trans isomerase [Fimbriimonadaceae bacterium]